MILRLLKLCFVGLSLAAPDDSRSARSGDYSVRYDAKKSAVIVEGIDAENLAKLSNADWPPERWAEVLTVSLLKKDAVAPIAGTYHIIENRLQFDSKFPIEPGLRHTIRFDPSRLPISKKSNPLNLEFERTSPPKSAPVFVSRVEPSGDVLPENLLKMYVYFSSPMSRGEVYDRVRITDAAGRKIESAFLEIGEELWDNTGTRITLLFDPGRIKRGLRPREEDGPILESGKTYTFQIDRDWPDATGQPMRESFKKTFRAGPADMTQPDPKTWTIESPVAGSRDSLKIGFPEPLDRAMLDRAIVLLDSSGARVSGKATVGSNSKSWSFQPEKNWRAGSYTLEIDPELEDLAGNSIARPFEVDVEGRIAPEKRESRVKLPITVSVPKP